MRLRSLCAMGRFLAVAAALWLVLFPTMALALPDTAKPSPNWKLPSQPHVYSGAAVLMDWRTGQVLWERNAFQSRDPASTTKVLTAILALERGKLDDQVKVSRRAAYTPGSSMYIKPGEVYSLHDLLHGLLLRSGNDAAAAIAEHIAGSVEDFAKLMNVKAKEIGAMKSHFVNPHGLTAAGHVTTAYDLALITRYALQNQQFRDIVALREAALTYEHLQRDVVLHNTNRLLSLMAEADGVKTGTTSAAGQCLVASATRDEHKLIAVVLHAGNRWGESHHLLEWGFKNFRLVSLGKQDEVVLSAPVEKGKPETVPLALSDDMDMVLPRTMEPPKLEVQVQDRIVAPIKKGQPLGRAEIREDGSVKDQAMLVASADVARRTLLDNLIHGLLPLIRWLTERNML